MSMKTNLIKKAILIFIISVISTSLIFISFAGHSIYAGEAITVFLDPGHGGSDSGCIHNGLLEKNVNLAISLKLKGILESNGYRVVMRRTNDSGMSLDDIVNMANRSGADLFLSIHNNASLSPASTGTETYWSANGVKGSSQFAASIQSNLVSAIGRPNRGVKSADFRVIKNTKMTAALVECVFVSNPDEANLLKNDGFLNKIAQGLFNGIHSFAKNISPSSSGGSTGGTYAAKRVLVNIDTPTTGQTIGGNFELVGWAVEEGGITSPEIDAVHVYDGPAAGAQNLIGIANYGISRPDVASNFGKDAFTKSGYSLMINCSTLSKGTHIIHVYAHNQVLGWGYATVKVNVLNDGTVVPASQGGVNTPTQGSTDSATVNGTTQTTTSGDSNTNYDSSGDKKVLISLDSPKNGQNVSGSLELTGWAIEASALNCSGITSVHVYDGKANGEQNMLGVATYGISRPDVADAFGRSGFKNSGFSLNIDSTRMKDGSHTLYVYAYNTYLGWKYATVNVNVANGGSGQTTNNTTEENIYLSQTKANITETNNSSGYLSSGVQKVLINVDTPQNGQALSGKFELTGWAVERSAVNSTGITAIHVYDGKANGTSNFLGVATYGTSRSDVADYFGKNNLRNSGFKLNIDGSKLSNGKHTLYVYAYNQNLGWKFTTVDVNIGGSTQETSNTTTQNTDTTTQGTASNNTTYTSSGKPKTLISVDTPGAGASVGGNFELAGWAVEQSAADATGITAVHVYNGPANGEQNMLGVAEYGLSRPDVATSLGRGNFTNSGFRLTVNSSKLSNGQHTLYVYAYNPNIGWKYVTLKINYTGSTSPAAPSGGGGVITNATNMVGYVDVTVDQLVRIFEIRGSSKTNWARRLAPLYIKWGQQFNLRADIAWAMMAHETGFLEFNGVADPSWNNFCGLGVTGPVGVGCRFESEELGVIAQYAHLAWYAYPSHVNGYCSKTYDPRHSDGHFFNGNSSVGTLNGRWAPASTYTDKILLFANQVFGR